MHDALGTLRDVLGSLPHLQWWITGAWLLYLVPLCAWIVLQKREPVATLSWLLSLALLPYIGYLIYFLLGPQRIKRHQLRRTRSREGVESYEVFAPTDGNSAELPMLAQKITGLPPSSATSVQQLVGRLCDVSGHPGRDRGGREPHPPGVLHLQRGQDGPARAGGADGEGA